jgi:hypothetical protein
MKARRAITGNNRKVFRIEPVDAVPDPSLNFDDISKLIEFAEGVCHK